MCCTVYFHNFVHSYVWQVFLKNKRWDEMVTAFNIVQRWWTHRRVVWLLVLTWRTALNRKELTLYSSVSRNVLQQDSEYQLLYVVCGIVHLHIIKRNGSFRDKPTFLVSKIQIYTLSQNVHGSTCCNLAKFQPIFKLLSLHGKIMKFATNDTVCRLAYELSHCRHKVQNDWIILSHYTLPFSPCWCLVLLDLSYNIKTVLVMH